MARWFWSVIWDGVDPKVDITDPITVKYIRTLVIVIAHTYRLLSTNAPRQTDAKAEGILLGTEETALHIYNPNGQIQKPYLPGTKIKKNIVHAESEITQETDGVINGEV